MPVRFGSFLYFNDRAINLNLGSGILSSVRPGFVHLVIRRQNEWGISAVLICPGYSRTRRTILGVLALLKHA
ncbi:hypothetical protein HBI56_151840 [Parastagonospora nodorum]|uniref:Uncharacterized protein n=1 Tax=Phaeosphaeria nodorum (strain SN15 / ATCC MYA-4574 / FGSC 10173) TaxID=321614 RepID=A0A7U2FF98_PHANO|nr:hypothetical protein HBH56_182670 [Parastagonospora nodorum]QRD04186.1 hypothetical protein JI435_420840 [Parastagonospora nodorum SN15]KAH3925999.1 hypothetical protein HBH54_171820 [Parastagonospora nodorum]KAH3944743.1 hypothetical protein HBH53_153090 [Parastagonospora nodorum]KAH3962493.1 hypothetical protein HBH52_223320 [Parastagonospora nodorum]